MRNPRVGMVFAFLLAVAMWCYADFILVPYQVSEAARSGRPRGNLSDLYPRWLGARELLLRGRDPYSPEVTREIQAGYYGRALDRSLPNDPRDQQGFAYPVYVVFLLAPATRFPFPAVQQVFRWLLLLLIVASVPLWLSALRARLSKTGMLTATVLVLGSFPAVQAIKLQQLTAVVCFLLAGCAAALATRGYVLAGFLLALATIKPQLALPFAAWLLLWSLGNWRSRQRLIWSLVATLAILIVGGEAVLPGWIGSFRLASVAYLQYAGGTSLLDLALTPAWGRVLSTFLILVVAYFSWRWRHTPVDSEEFHSILALFLAAILVVIPTFAPYNQLLLIPALLLLARWAPCLWHAGVVQRLSMALVALVILLPWLAAAALDLMLLFLSRETVERAWAVPLWTSWAIPFPVLAALLLGATQSAKQQSLTVPGEPARIKRLR